MKRPRILLISILLMLLVCVSLLLWIFLMWKHAAPIEPKTNTPNIKLIGYIDKSSKTISQSDSRSYATGLAVADGFAYIFIPICVDDTDDALRHMCNTSQIRVIDVSDPTKPKEIGVTAPLEFKPSDMAISKNFAYISSYHGVTVLDMSNRLAPIKVGSYERLLKRGFNYAETYNLRVKNDQLYVISKECQIGIRCIYAKWTLDTSTPPVLSEIKIQAITEDDASEDKLVTQNYVFIQGGNNGLTITDHSNPAKEIGYYNIPDGVWSIAVNDTQEDGYFYIAGQYGDIYILQLIANPE